MARLVVFILKTVSYVILLLANTVIFICICVIWFVVGYAYYYFAQYLRNRFCPPISLREQIRERTAAASTSRTATPMPTVMEEDGTVLEEVNPIPSTSRPTSVKIEVPLPSVPSAPMPSAPPSYCSRTGQGTSSWPQKTSSEFADSLSFVIDIEEETFRNCKSKKFL